jgi:beta-galactosidase
MIPITFTPTAYFFAGEPHYLNSGEFHYFRVPKADWRRRMRLFKEAGGNVLATYIPWLLHEPEEGHFVWGDTAEYLDLDGFLQTAREEGLYIIARPGPYQYSELVYDGLPGWLCDDYPELLARNRQGEIFRKSSVSYIHPLFWEKVRNWYDVVCPILARYTLANDGPIAFVQIDNELVGIHEWFGSLDYNPVSMGFGDPHGRYPCWLQVRYLQISALNAHYATNYTSFTEVEPLQSDDSDIFAIRRRKDYFHFYLDTVVEYARFLVDQIRAHGIDLPIVHNSANPGMNAYFLEVAAELGETFLLGSDHYYNLDQTWPQNHPTPQYAVRSFVSLEMLRLMGYPPTVFELPGGSCSNWPPVTASDALACYLTNLAFGMKGHNYYIFTGGPNPPGAGTHTDIYDYDAGISASGEIRPLYEVQKTFGKIIAERPWLVAATRQTDFRVALDLEYSRTDHYWTDGGDLAPSPREAWDLLRSGPLTTAFCAGLSPEMVRLDFPITPGTSPLLVVTSSSMAAAKQQALVNYLSAGGKALILPVLPWLDDDLTPCTILADYLGSPLAISAPKDIFRPTIGGVSNVRGNVTRFWENISPDAEIVGVEEKTGQVIAWKAPTSGGGEVIVAGFSWLHAMRQQEQMLGALLLRLGLQPCIQCSNPNIWVTLWMAGERGVLFLMNLFTEPLTANVRVTLPNGRVLEIGEHVVGQVSVKVVDINF